MKVRKVAIKMIWELHEAIEKVERLPQMLHGCVLANISALYLYRYHSAIEKDFSLKQENENKMDKQEKYENEYGKDEEKSEERKQRRFLCQYNMKGYQIFAIFVVIFAISIKRMLIARTTERKQNGIQVMAGAT